MNYSESSKEISYALGHAPEEYGLNLKQGWVMVEDLITALKKREKYSALAVRDIADMIMASSKSGMSLAVIGYGLYMAIPREIRSKRMLFVRRMFWLRDCS